MGCFGKREYKISSQGDSSRKTRVARPVLQGRLRVFWSEKRTLWTFYLFSIFLFVIQTILIVFLCVSVKGQVQSPRMV
jgi:hypothetical protein